MNEKRFIAGIDPGKNGAVSFLLDSGEVIESFEYAKYTEHELAEALGRYGPKISKTYLEFASSRPGQGVKSVFSFGTNYGFWRGLLTALKIPYEIVTPGTWQRSLKCLSKGNKNITKAKAQQLFPASKITHAIADSLLIAEFGRRING